MSNGLNALAETTIGTLQRAKNLPPQTLEQNRLVTDIVTQREATINNLFGSFISPEQREIGPKLQFADTAKMYDLIFQKKDGFQAMLQALPQLSDNQKTVMQALSDIARTTGERGMMEGGSNRLWVHIMYYPEEGEPRLLTQEEQAIFGLHEVIHAKTKRIEQHEGDDIHINRGFQHTTVDTKQKKITHEYGALDEAAAELINAAARHPEYLDQRAPLSALHLAVDDDLPALSKDKMVGLHSYFANFIVRTLEIAFKNESEKTAVSFLAETYFNSDLEGFFTGIRQRLDPKLHSAFANFEEASRTDDFANMFNYMETISSQGGFWDLVRR